MPYELARRHQSRLCGLTSALILPTYCVASLVKILSVCLRLGCTVWLAKSFKTPPSTPLHKCLPEAYIAHVRPSPEGEKLLA